MRTWVWISLAAFAALLLGGFLAADPLARRLAESHAKERGLVLTASEVSLGWFEVDLKGVGLGLEGVEGIRIDLKDVEVDVGLTAPRIRSVEVVGGLVQIEGTTEDIRARIDAWRARRGPREKVKSSSGPTRTEVVRQLDIVWTNALGNGKNQTITGVQIERSARSQKFGADHLALSLGSFQAEIAGVVAEFPAGGLDLAQAKKLGASEMRVTYSAAPKARGDDKDDALQPAAPPAPTDSPPTVTAITPDNETQASGLETLLHSDPTRVARLSAALGLARREILPRLPREANVERLFITFVDGREKLHVGPSELIAKKEASGAYLLAVRPRGSAKGTPLSLELSLLPEANENAMKASLEGGPVAFETLGISEGAFGLSGVNQTQLSGKVDVTVSQGLDLVQGEGNLNVEGLALFSERLSSKLVTFPKLSVSGKGKWKVDGSQYEVSSASLALGETRFEGGFALERADNFVTLKASARAPLVACQALLDSAPRGLLGEIELVRFDGTFSLDAGVEADTQKLGDMKIRWDFKNDCKVRAVPAGLDPDQFRGAFRREVIGAGNFPVEMEFGPFAPNWVPWDEVSPFVEKALLVTEDGRFYRHDGFDNRAIESAIAANVRAGSFVRGASTISMQLAKNLYLSRSKTLARKLQEAALTLLLEQSFEKRQLLELYVNVVEFGPGIYGIRQAAEHYFNTTPAALTPAQSFFLASILPAPTRAYFEADGSLRRTQLAYVHRLLGISAQREALTEAELVSALAEQLRFGVPDTTPTTSETSDDAGLAPKAPSPGSQTPGGLSPRTPSPDEPIFPGGRALHPSPAP